MANDLLVLVAHASPLPHADKRGHCSPTSQERRWRGFMMADPILACYVDAEPERKRLAAFYREEGFLA